MVLMPSKTDTPYLTSYDLLKSLALLLMLLDHVGYYFYPQNEWFRVVGRACVPIWFFLVGYARSRDLSKPLWIGAGLIILANFALGGGIFPLNILVTIIVVRLALDRVAHLAFRDWENATYTAFGLSVLFLPTFFAFEYGTAALLLALCGYIIRNAERMIISQTAQRVFIVYALTFFAFTQLITFNMTHFQSQAMVIGIGMSAILLYFFRPKEVPEVENSLPRPLVGALQFGGRYTLEIYVFHLILFKAICCLLGLKGYGIFNWGWIR